MLSYTEENYIKAIFHLAEINAQATTNAIAEMLHTKPASVTDMLKKLAAKKVVHYEKYQGVELTVQGKKIALQVIRKHRLWEVFLVEKLNFHWDQVHEIAEQLEHIQSNLLTERLDAFLNYPSTDPHGDPIPDKHGQLQVRKQMMLEGVEKNYKGKVVCLRDDSSSFLKYMDKLGIRPGVDIHVLDKINFDGSLEVRIDKGDSVSLSRTVTQNITVSL